MNSVSSFSVRLNTSGVDKVNKGFTLNLKQFPMTGSDTNVAEIDVISPLLS